MAGFTAINAANPGPSKSGIRDAPQKNMSQGNNSTSTTIASEYLGRGKGEIAVPAINTGKKTATRGKKRVSDARESQASKSRRTSSLKDGLSITKAGAATAKERVVSLKPNQKKKRTSSRLTQMANQVSISEPASTAAKSNSVYAQATSMDALDTTSTRTSIDIAKANGGSGIIYQGPSSTASFSSSVECVKPLWDTRATTHRQEVPTQNSQHCAPLSEIADEYSTARASHIFNDFSTDYQPELEPRSEEDFDDIEPADLEELADAMEEIAPARPATPNRRERKQNMRDVEENEDYGGALVSSTDRKILGESENESLWSCDLFVDKQPEDLKKIAESSIKPIVRQAFPNPVLDRSPIHGASKGVALRTCFRVGEAMVAGTQSIRNGTNTVIELYARVSSSWREPSPGRKQHFVFKDLYHDRPPHLEGTYELWGQAPLWELDSKPFLSATEQGIMCRAIARMRREGQKWRLEVLSIWEASWEDINYVAGIYDGNTANC